MLAERPAIGMEWGLKKALDSTGSGFQLPDTHQGALDFFPDVAASSAASSGKRRDNIGKVPDVFVWRNGAWRRIMAAT